MTEIMGCCMSVPRVSFSGGYHDEGKQMSVAADVNRKGGDKKNAGVVVRDNQARTEAPAVASFADGFFAAAFDMLRGTVFSLVGCGGGEDRGGVSGTGGTGGTSGVGGTSGSGISSSLSGNIVKIAAGANYSLALKNDGTLWGTGWNDYGELGTGDHTRRNTWEEVLSDVAAVAAGSSYSLAIRNDGTLWVTGKNDYGQLGTGDWDNRNTWEQSLLDVTAVAAGNLHSLAVKNDGTLWVTGMNNSDPPGDNDSSASQLGTGDREDRNTWEEVLSGVSAAAGGLYHSLAIMNDGTLWGTGWNGYGQLGTGDNENNRNTWGQVFSSVIAVATEVGCSLVIRSDGTLWGTGSNYWGQLGTGDTTNRNNWEQILSEVTVVAAGDEHSLAVRNDGTLWGTGRNHSIAPMSNSAGQLGLGDTTDRHVWEQVLTDVTAAVGGFEHSLAIRNDGTLWVTGENYYGQLGTGDNEDRNTWEQVSE
jgi:alpha-tubulin suppressor-like RCC1 family protein